MLAQALHIGDQIPCRILAKLRMGGGFSTTPLVEQDDAIGFRIMRPAHGWVRTAARPAMHDDDGFALRIAAFLKLDGMQIRYFDRPRPVGLDLGIKAAAVGGAVRHDRILEGAWRRGINPLNMR